MTTYSYSTEDGEVFEREYAMGEHPGSIKVSGGRVANRDLRADLSKTSTCPGNWPKTSDAMGVAPSQVKEAHEASVAAGCPTQFDRNGSAILTSPGHKRKLARSLGMHDRNAGYSDATPD